MSAAAARFAAAAYRGVVAAVDLLPAGWRYGYVTPVAARVLGGDQPAGFRPVTPAPAPATATPASGPERPVPAPRLHVGLVTGRLDVGGVEAVVAMLTERLPHEAVRCTVVCTQLGRTAATLRTSGAQVEVVTTAEQAAATFRAIGADVLQLHNAPPFLVAAARRSGLPLVPVVHNTEVYNTGEDWRAAAELLDHSPQAVAVSAAVRDYYRAHLPREAATAWSVVPNAAPVGSVRTSADRDQARELLGGFLGVELATETVLVCPARYDAQKNLPGTVAAFHSLASSPGRHRLRLVIAGEVTDWVEHRRADAVRRAGPMRDRVHLLGNSDTSMLLAAADGLLLDSFFEGWPVVGSEAVTAGLPLVIADVGGAVELVSAGHGVVVPNPAGPTAGLDPRVLARARRARSQVNVPALHAALLRVGPHDLDRRSPLRAEQVSAAVDAMARAHAAVLAAAAGSAL